MAGVEVRAARTLDEAKHLTLALMAEADIGVIAVSSSFLNDFDDLTRRRLDESYKPVIVALPAGVPVRPEARRSRQVADLIRRAIGFRISFNGEDLSNG